MLENEKNFTRLLGISDNDLIYLNSIIDDMYDIGAEIDDYCLRKCFEYSDFSDNIIYEVIRATMMEMLEQIISYIEDNNNSDVDFYKNIKIEVFANSENSTGNFVLNVGNDEIYVDYLELLGLNIEDEIEVINNYREV